MRSSPRRRRACPSRSAGARNWDYRYTWIRDAAFSLYALLRLGFTDEAEAFMDWLRDRVVARTGPSNGPLQIMYGIDGRSELTEETLDHLEGYRGSAPVRIGNGAYDQLQLDIYGELMDSVYLFNKYGRPISHDGWMELSRARRLGLRRLGPAGRGDLGDARRAAELHVLAPDVLGGARAGDPDRAPARAARRPRHAGGRPATPIYHQIMSKGWNEKRQAFVQHFDTDVLDASLLLMPLVKFVAPTDPRWLSTLDAITRELVSDSLVYRYNIEASPDGLAGDEGTFSICSFWYVEALARAGRLEEARLAFEKMLTYANHLGLYSEEIGPTGEQLGNFPQAFTHLALISAAVNLDYQLG